MAQDYVIRCRPDDPTASSYIVRDDSGEVIYYPNAANAAEWASEYQDASKTATYTIEPARV